MRLSFTKTTFGGATDLARIKLLFMDMWKDRWIGNHSLLIDGGRIIWKTVEGSSSRLRSRLIRKRKGEVIQGILLSLWMIAKEVLMGNRRKRSRRDPKRNRPKNNWSERERPSNNMQNRSGKRRKSRNKKRKVKTCLHTKVKPLKSFAKRHSRIKKRKTRWNTRITDLTEFNFDLILMIWFTLIYHTALFGKYYLSSLLMSSSISFLWLVSILWRSRSFPFFLMIKLASNSLRQSL